MPRSLAAIALVIGLVACLGLSACGGGTKTVTESSSPSTGDTGTATSSGTTPATTTTATTTTGTTSSTPTTSTTAGSPPCTAAVLRLAYLGGQGATGHGELGFSLTNTGPGSCHTFGYPGVQFQSSAGAALPTNSMRTTHDFFGDAPQVKLTLAPGDSASFRLGVTHVAQGGSGAGCTTAVKLQVIPPDDTHTLLIDIPNGGAYECGTTTVSPLQPGNSAYR